MTWRPKFSWRIAIVVSVFALAAVPALVGLSMLDEWRDFPTMPLALIVLGPLLVLSVFVALTPVLEGWWLRKWRGRDEPSSEEQEGE